MSFHPPPPARDEYDAAHQHNKRRRTGPPSVPPAAALPAASSPFSSSPLLSPSLPASADPRPCMVQFHPDGCHGRCAFLHASYVRLFAALCDSQPSSMRSIPAISDSFHPILARIGPPSSSSSAIPYIVSFPFPRLPAVLSRVLGPGGSVLRCMQALSGLQQPRVDWRVYDRYAAGAPPEGWMTMSVEGDKENIDVLMECVFWTMAEGIPLSPRERPAALEEHIRGYRQRKGRARLDDNRDFFALQSRELSHLRPPTATPRSSPPHPPPAASPHAAPPSHPVPAMPPPAAAYAPTPAQQQLPAHPGYSPPPPLHQPPHFPLPAAAAVGPPAGSPPPQASRTPAAILEMRAYGRTLPFSSPLQVPDFTSSPAPFLCSLPHCVFACLPIPASKSRRDLLAYDELDGVPSIPEIEQQFAVEVFIPRLTSDAGETRNTQGRAFLNVCISCRTADVAAGGGAVETVEEAMLCLISRCHAFGVLQQPL